MNEIKGRDDPPREPLESLVITPGNVVPPYLRRPDDGGGENGELQPSKWVVLAVLFVVTGAFGLPLLWRSDEFGRWERWFWAVTVIIYTCLLLAFMVMMVQWSLGE